MSNSTPPVPPQRTGLSLYANLLDPNAANTPGSITKAPVVFKTAAAEAGAEDSTSKKTQIDAATLRFQPTKRPQLSQKPKPKSSFPKLPPPETATKGTNTVSGSAKLAAKSTLADWTGAGQDDDVNGFYAGEKRARGGKKRRKKNKEEYSIAQDWDDIYDPARPNNYEEYKHSDEKIREVTEWKDRLYAHRRAKKDDSDLESDEEEYRPRLTNQFAPPSNYSFAPPPMDPPPRKATEETSDNVSSKPESNSDTRAVPSAAATAEISRAPVRYNLPAAPSEIPSSEAELEKALADEVDEEEPEEDAPRSLRPGQKGFAERLMSKYGWSKGTGLGADGSGIVNPLRVQIEKRKKKSDAEGGGFRDSGGRGKIIGGKKNVPEKDSEVGKFGPMSEVIVLRGMVDGMNLDQELEGAGDGGLMQEIGDECGEKYGRVERVYIDRSSAPAKVFVKFTSQLSGLRAVNALEGRVFGGNTISALFYDAEKFEQGIYG